MKPAERENLIAVKTMLAEKYRRKSHYAGSLPKRRQSQAKSTSYLRQAEVLRRAQESA